MNTAGWISQLVNRQGLLDRPFSEAFRSYISKLFHEGAMRGLEVLIEYRSI